MSNKKIILLTFFLLFTTLCFSQRFVGSVIAGMNATQVDGDEVYGFKKLGTNAGASVMLALDKKQRWFATVELLYSQKGSKSKSYFDTTAYAASMFADVDRSVAFDNKKKCRLRLDYVEVPLLFHYEDWKTGCAIGIGAAWSRLVYASETYNGFKRTTDVRSGTYAKNDWSAIADIKIRLWKGLKLNLRYQYSFIPIRSMTFTTVKTNGDESSWNRKLYNSVLTLRIIYSFNEKFIPNGNTDKNGHRKGPKWVREVNSF